MDEPGSLKVEPGSGKTNADERAAIAGRAGTVAAGTLLSRVLGLARDSVIAAVFSKDATDVFFAAFTIPNSLRVLLGEGAASAAIVPVFTEVRAREGAAGARRFHAAFTGAMLLVLTVVTVAGVLAAPWLAIAYAGGFRESPEKWRDTITLTRLVFPYIFFMGVAALGMGALHALKRFFVPAFAPSLLNVAMILAAFSFGSLAYALGLPFVGALGLGALLGGVLQVIAQAPALRAVGLLQWPRFDLRDPGVRKAFSLLVPLLAGLGIYQLNVMLSGLFASYLPPGSRSYLYYGQRVVEMPQGMFALAIASATLPTLSELREKQDLDELRRVFGYGLRLSLFVAIPSTVLLVLLAEPTVAILFGRGEFEATAIRETARSLAWQSAGIWAIASVRTIVPAFYAYNDTRTPVLGSGINLIVFVVLSFLLMGPMTHAGIAAALSGAGIAQLLTLLWMLRRRVGRLGLREVVVSASRIAVCSAAMGAVAWTICKLGVWERGGNDMHNVIVYAAAVVAAVATYVLVARIIRTPELFDVIAPFQRRFARER